MLVMVSISPQFALFITCFILTISICSSFTSLHPAIRRTPLQEASNNIDNSISDGSALKQIDDWACIKNCGACCKLGPIEDRPDLKDYLSSEQFDLYSSMIGADNWCKNFDQANRMCTIYETRPIFCRVEPANIKTMFDIEPEEFSDFCRFCCTENIDDVYGSKSEEMKAFKKMCDQIDESNTKEDEGETIEEINSDDLEEYIKNNSMTSEADSDDDLLDDDADEEEETK